jgi:hypothetical protein
VVPIICVACKLPIETVAVYLGETYDGVEKEWPFHESCADQPWPLYEIRRQIVAGLTGETITVTVSTD